MRRSHIITMVASIAMAVCFVTTGFAQNRERHVISAKAGGVNSVNGRVMLSKTGLEPQLLTPQDDLAAGDTVTTSAGSQAEILLNPGSYLRLGENSVFTLADNSLDNLLITLKSGSAIIEATGPDDATFRINVATAHERLAIVRSGIYRINVTADSTELLVRKGRVLLSDGQLIKGGRKITFSSGSVLTAKLDKRDNDSFDLWSKQRAETLAQANTKLTNRVLNGYLSDNGWDLVFSRNRWGLWTYNWRFGCYTFLPFYYGWSSPYGNYYGNYFNFHYFRHRGLPGMPSSGGGVIVNNPPSPRGSGGGPSVGPTNPGTGPSGPTVQAPRTRDPDSAPRISGKPRDPIN
jgi:FecR protein